MMLAGGAILTPIAAATPAQADPTCQITTAMVKTSWWLEYYIKLNPCMRSERAWTDCIEPAGSAAVARWRAYGPWVKTGYTKASCGDSIAVRGDGGEQVNINGQIVTYTDWRA